MAIYLEHLGTNIRDELKRVQQAWWVKPLGSHPTRADAVRWLAENSIALRISAGEDPQRLPRGIGLEELWFYGTLLPFVSVVQDIEPVAVKVDGDVANILRSTRLSTRNFDEALDLLSQRHCAYIDFSPETAPELVAGWLIRAIVMTSYGEQGHASWAMIEHAESGRFCRATWIMKQQQITDWVMLNFVPSLKHAQLVEQDDPSISRIEEEIGAVGLSGEEVLQDLQALGMNALLLWKDQGEVPPEYSRSHPRVAGDKRAAKSRKRSPDRLFTPVSLKRPQIDSVTNDNEFRGGYHLSGGVFLVRGHYRWQACGPKHSERRLIWVAPFRKGGQSANDNNPPPRRPRLYIVR